VCQERIQDDPFSYWIEEQQVQLDWRTNSSLFWADFEFSIYFTVWLWWGGLVTKGYRRYIRLDHGWLRHWYAAALDLKFLAAARPYWQDFGKSRRQCILEAFASLTPSHANFQGRNKVQGQHLMSRSTGATVCSDRAGFWRPPWPLSLPFSWWWRQFLERYSCAPLPLARHPSCKVLIISVLSLSLFVRVTRPLPSDTAWDRCQRADWYKVTVFPCAAPAAHLCSTATSWYCQYIYRHATRAPISTSARRRRAPTSSDMRSQNRCMRSEDRVVKFPKYL